jgi:hypothetical protein
MMIATDSLMMASSGGVQQCVEVALNTVAVVYGLIVMLRRPLLSYVMASITIATVVSTRVVLALLMMSCSVGKMS